MSTLPDFLTDQKWFESEGQIALPHIMWLQNIVSQFVSTPVGIPLTVSKDVQTDSDGNAVSVTNTGTLLNVMSESPTITGTLSVESLTTTKGRVQATTRITTTYTILATDEIIYCDTDSGAFTVTLPTGIDGTHYRILNIGTSGNNVTLASSEKIYGSTSNETIMDLENFDLNFETTEGWS